MSPREVIDRFYAAEAEYMNADGAARSEFADVETQAALHDLASRAPSRERAGSVLHGDKARQAVRLVQMQRLGTSEASRRRFKAMACLG